MRKSLKHVFLRTFLPLQIILCARIDIAYSQTKEIDNKTFTAYRASDFRPPAKILFSIYVSPVFTFDPMGRGGKSTYGVSLGAAINLWESKLPTSRNIIKGIYLGAGYEYYPQTFDLTYLSLWLRFRALVPLVVKFDEAYSKDGLKSGFTTRYGIGVDIKRISILICGSYYHNESTDHPAMDAEYTHDATLMVIIPIYKHD